MCVFVCIYRMMIMMQVSARAYTRAYNIILSFVHLKSIRRRNEKWTENERKRTHIESSNELEFYSWNFFMMFAALAIFMRFCVYIFILCCSLPLSSIFYLFLSSSVTFSVSHTNALQHNFDGLSLLFLSLESCQIAQSRNINIQRFSTNKQTNKLICVSTVKFSGFSYRCVNIQLERSVFNWINDDWMPMINSMYIFVPPNKIGWSLKFFRFFSFLRNAISPIDSCPAQFCESFLISTWNQPK